jgi:hypothetical protein
MRAERSSSLSSGDCPLSEPLRSRPARSPAGIVPDSAASADSKAVGLLPAEVKREAEEGPLLSDVDLREQAVLMALFEDRRRSSRDAAVAAALAKADRTPLQDGAAAAVGQADRRQLGRSVSAPAAADADAESAAKRQRTLRGFFQVLQRG